MISRKHQLGLGPLLAAMSLFVAGSANVASGELGQPEAFPGEPGAPHASLDRSGVVGTSEGQTLKLSADLGAVRIYTLEPGAAPVVRYTVRIETDASKPLADHLLSQYALAAKATPAGVQISGTLPPQIAHGRASEAQFWVHFDVTVPRNYNVEVLTGAGDIEMTDLAGTARLNTQGGNIRAGKIGFAGEYETSGGKTVARLETEGGHISVQDVAGDLFASTGGGHINAGNIAGSASLHSGGGHLHAGRIAGRAELDTEGGNITVREVGSTVAVRTGGGQIDFGEVRGSVRAQTGGGGIRMMYVAGPMEVETSAGSICLTRVAGSVRAETAGGTITAWINPDTPAEKGAVQLAGASQLVSRAGDILVFLPRNLAVTIDATVERGGDNRIQADPSLPLILQSEGPRGPVRATGAINGGGAPLRLKTIVGKIRLQYLDSDLALRESLIREQIRRINSEVSPEGSLTKEQSAVAVEEERGGWFSNWWDTVEDKFRGGLSEDPEELQKRLIYSPPPVYPLIAKKAGIQGVVRLRVRVGKDGRVEVLKIEEGEPVLADAAVGAVKQWRYKRKSVNGKPVNVISEVRFNFLLH